MPEEWHCGTCAYWEIVQSIPREVLGECRNKEAMKKIVSGVKYQALVRPCTSRIFGCRFWSAKPLNEQAS
jgi:hypothetical protein